MQQHLPREGARQRAAARRRVGLRRDPRPAARGDARASSRDRSASTAQNTKWIWRCHIDLTDANPTVWEFFRPFVEQHDASVWTMPEFVPASLDDGPRRARAAVHRPAVGEEPRAADAVRARRSPSSTASTSHRPDRVPGEPVRPVEGPGRRHRGVPHRARASSRRAARARGLDGHRRPRGLPGLGGRPRRRAAGDRDIHLLSNIQQVGIVQINAFQRVADVVMQKSLREGFGLTVSEGLWKGRPVVGGRAGGITLQIHDGVRRLPRRLRRGVRASAPSTCSPIPVGADAMGAAGPRARARQLPLDARARRLADGCSRSCARVIVVSHRGPFRFSMRATTASFAAQPRRGWPRRARCTPWLRPPTCATRVVDRGRDQRRRPRRARTAPSSRRLEHRPAAARPRSRRSPLHYDVVSNEVLWFLHPRPVRPASASPRSTATFRDAWDGYVAVNQAFADAVVAHVPRAATWCSCRTTSSRSCRAWLRERRPTCASCTSRTRRSAVPTDPRAARPTSPRRSARRSAAVPAGSTPNGGPRRTRQSAREVLGRDRRRDSCVRRAARTRPRRAWPESRPRDDRGAARRGARRRWSATGC